jgi:FkbM family methyltransferase
VKFQVNKLQDHTKIILGDTQFIVPSHWFWDQAEDNWEPQTFRFFERNLICGTDFLDIGAWVGPTSMIATALGARKSKIIEPNPVNFWHLLVTQINNPELFQSWFLVNACVSDKAGSARIGPLSGIKSGSSATNIRQNHADGAEIISLRLEDMVKGNDNFSLVKVDIEGAEASILPDLKIFAKSEAAVWLSLHPPFISEKEKLLHDVLQLTDSFYLTDDENKPLAEEVLKEFILTEETHPRWGTKWGNFFEIGLLPKQAFNESGNRKRPSI